MRLVFVMLSALARVKNNVMHLQFAKIQYSQTSEQRTLWEQYKLKSFVLICREVVLFLKVQNVLEP